MKFIRRSACLTARRVNKVDIARALQTIRRARVVYLPQYRKMKKSVVFRVKRWYVNTKSNNLFKG